MNIKDKYPIREANVAYRVIEDSTILVRTSKSGDMIFHTLNEVGTRIWDLCNGKITIKGIVSHILKEYEVKEKALIKDCLEIINILKDKELLSLKDKLVSTQE